MYESSISMRSYGAATQSCIMHDPGRVTLCKNAVGNEV